MKKHKEVTEVRGTDEANHYLKEGWTLVTVIGVEASGLIGPYRIYVMAR